MIDLKALRDDPDRFRAGARAKGSDADLDALLAADRDLRAAQTELQELTAEKNRIGKAIGQLAGRLKKADAADRPALQQEMADLQARPNQIKAQEGQLAERVRTLTVARDALWLAVPQPPDPDVPAGTSDADNVELSRWTGAGERAFDPERPFAEQRGFAPKTHLELCADLGLVDFDRAVKIAGSRSYTLMGDGMRLQQAVLRLALDTMADAHGFTPVSAADLVRHETMVGTGFFPHGRDQVYDIANPTGDYGLALSGTGEVSLMAFHADEILAEDDLPLRYVTQSTCFRREAGAAGRDTAGLYRVHQFDKVEQVVICKADEAESRAWHQKMLGYVEGLLRKLELPHRRLQCCTGDLGLKNADMIDVECWMPGRGALDDAGLPTGGWGETHSASRLYDFQCRRLNLRYRDAETGQTRVAHSLNNTVAALPRLLIPILEMHQQADGSIRVAEALRPYLGGRERIG
ncbi:MAG: serine--tRNA ligase [Planctomycetota bacterium]